MKNFMRFIFCILSTNAFAAPYWGNIEKFTQPDGSTVEVKLYGDEFYIRAEGLDGYTVVRDKKTNWICYATLSADASELTSTGIRYLGVQANPSSLRSSFSFARHLEINQNALEKIQAANDVLLNGEKAGSRNETFQTPLRGVVKGLSVIVDFSDKPGTLTLKDFQDFMNGTNYTGFGNKGSIKEFFFDITGGVVIYDNVVYGYYRAPKTFAQYDAMPYAAGAQEILGLALNWIKSQGFDFSTLTTTNGYINAINLMYTGNPPTWAQGMWFHKGSYTGFSANGVKSRDYNCSPANNPLTMGVICHENGHMVGGWPDTYKYSSTTGPDGIGAFDLMCAYGSSTNPVPPNPYFLSKNGYGKTIDVTTSGADVNDAPNSLIFYKYRNVNNAAEFFITQTKRKIGRSTVNPDEGVTIWKINVNGSNQNQPANHQVFLVHANNNTSAHSGACYKPGKQEFNDNTTPNAHWLNGSNSGFRVWDWGALSATSMHYKIGTPATSVNDLSNGNSLSIFPNPAEDQITIQPISGEKSDLNITLLDVTGKTILKKQGSQASVYTIDISDLVAGVYIVNVCSGQSSSNHKVIKQ